MMHLEEDILIFPCKNLEDEEDLYQINYQPYDGTGQKKRKPLKVPIRKKGTLLIDFLWIVLVNLCA
jgi:hypothetical protein